MHIFGKDQLITPWTMCKRVQEDHAQKLTNLSIWMHLSQKKHLTTVEHARISYFYVYKKKEDRLTLIKYLHLLDGMYILINLSPIKYSWLCN